MVSSMAFNERKIEKLLRRDLRVSCIRSSYADVSRCKSISLPNCSTHLMANASSVKRLLEARARFRMANVASSDIERADSKADA